MCVGFLGLCKYAKSTVVVKQTLLSYTCSMEISSRQFVYIAERLRTYYTRNSVRHATKQETRPTRLWHGASCVVEQSVVAYYYASVVRKRKHKKRATKNASIFWRSSVAQRECAAAVSPRVLCNLCFTIGPRNEIGSKRSLARPNP